MKKIVIFLAVFFGMSAALFAGGAQSGAQGTAAGTNAAGAIPSYINLDGYFPIVKQGTNVTMTVSWQPDETWARTSNPADIWYFTFVKRAMNINLDVSTRAPGNEVKNLMFASGDLPDIWLGSLSPNDIVTYGVSEKQLVPISDYLNPTLMPNLYKVYSDNPELKGPSTASDGKIYSFANIRGKEWLHGPITGGLARAFFNQKWLDKLGIKVPETLDQYLDVLRAFKTLGSDVVPESSIFTAANNFMLVYTALGFHWTGGNNITGVGTRNGKVTFVFGDRDIYPKFVETYKTMYDEGLIFKDYFTMTNNARNAFTMTGKAGTLVGPPITYVDPQYYFDYVSAKPLTSELNKTLFWVSPANYVNANFVSVTSNCKYPEAAMRLFDFNYTPENTIIAYFGYPDTQPAMNYGMIPGWTIKGNLMDMNIDNTALYPSEYYFVNSRVRPLHGMIGITNNAAETAMQMYGMNPPKEAFDPTNADSFARQSTYENISKYAVTEFPFIVYWDPETAQRLTDLSSVLNDYAETQFAQFVTGGRPLSDMNNYFAELDKMGYQEYIKYYSDYYDKVKISN
ncbi:MAG: hypothetical protein FWD78_11295 [Treponema sp.]|nr:hypothetical protein [Treponema sp.]